MWHKNPSWNQGKESTRERPRERETVRELAKENRSRDFDEQFLQQFCSNCSAGAICQSVTVASTSVLAFYTPQANCSPVALTMGGLLVIDVFTLKRTGTLLWQTRGHKSLLPYISYFTIEKMGERI